MVPYDAPPDYPERIKQLRSSLDLTQAQIGELLGVSTPTVSRWERGQLKPSSTQWQRIAEAEEHGLYALARSEPRMSQVAEDREAYGQPPPLDFAANPEVVRVVAEAYRLSYGHLFNPAFASEVSLIEPLPHQRIAVYEHLLPQPRIRFLLADDPGAGKTIMSGLLIRELLSRRLIRRVLIVPPAGLVGNWKREMRTLFSLPFKIVSGSDAKSGNPFIGEDSDLVIVSVDTLAGERMFARLQEPGVEPYDIVFFDEAHKLSANRTPDLTIDKTERYRLAEALAGIPSSDARWSLGWSCHHLLLLTATPHMGREYPFYALFRLLDPDIFGSEESFNNFPRAARARYFIRRTKEEMVRYDGTLIYPKRNSDTFGCAMSSDEENLYNLTTEYIHAYYNKASILNRSAARLAMSVFQRRLTSSTWALLRSFERRQKKLDVLIADIKSGRISENELDARQRKLGSGLPEPLDAKTADEEDGEENEGIEERALGGVAAVSVSELQAERAHVTMLLEIAREVDEKGDESKFDRLRELIRDPRFKDEKVLIFTEHRDTLDFLVRKLGSIGFAGKIAQIHGSMPYGEEADVERLRERQDNVEFFRLPAAQGGATYMVCTDAAAEGINLQFCWLMVNYDIPWNPARLEQRMGRIHRFGQLHDSVYIFNLVSDPEKTREGRVLKTLLDKLEKIRKDLGQDKVFDVIGLLLDGKSLAGYMEDIAAHGKAESLARDMDAKITRRRVEEIEHEDRERYGQGGEIARELPKLKQQLALEERRRMMPGYVRRFVEKAAPLINVGLEGDTGAVFSLRAQRPYALDRLLPLMDAYPPEKRNRFSVRKPRDSEHAVFLHPGEPVFDKVQTSVTGRFEREALRGGVFVDAHAHEPYGFHLARVTVVRRADPSLPALARPDVIESRLIGIKQNSHTEECAVEHLMLLRGTVGVPASAQREAADLAAHLDVPEAYARTVGRTLAQEHRSRVAASVAQRQEYVRASYDYEEIDLSEARDRLKDKAGAGDCTAQQELAKVKLRQTSFLFRREGALAVLEREPELFDVGHVELLAHALVIPSSDPEDKRRQDAEVELIAMAVVQAHEEAAGARFVEVHTPALARLAGLADFPGFDAVSFRGEEERDIEIKGRARVGEVELSENEWARAATLRDKYWLYVVFDCATDRPRLHLVRDPFGTLLMRSRTSAVVAADEILRHSEVGEGGIMASPTKPEALAGAAPEGETDIDGLLALLEQWQAAPLEDESGTVAELDRAFREEPIKFHDLDLDGWEEENE